MTDRKEPAKAASDENSRGRIILTAITILCFVYLFWRLWSAAAREGMPLWQYMLEVFAAVNWGPWMLLMMGYSCIYFLIDTLIAHRAVAWFISPIPFSQLLPVRASAYIISLFNEQIGKGAMAYYLYKRHKSPAWEVGSVMGFIMFSEFFYLLTWATLGYFVTSADLPLVFDLIPSLALTAVLFLALWIGFFRGYILPSTTLRDHRLLHAFRKATWHYGAFLLLRSPALIAAIFVYTWSLQFFGVEAEVLGIWPYLPIIFFAAAVPTPMRAVAITMWVVLFPDQDEGKMLAFGFFQHNFFILFNALIGLLFWRQARQELFPKK